MKENKTQVVLCLLDWIVSGSKVALLVEYFSLARPRLETVRDGNAGRRGGRFVAVPGGHLGGQAARCVSRGHAPCSGRGVHAAVHFGSHGSWSSGTEHLLDTALESLGPGHQKELVGPETGCRGESDLQKTTNSPAQLHLAPVKQVLAGVPEKSLPKCLAQTSLQHMRQLERRSCLLQGMAVFVSALSPHLPSNNWHLLSGSSASI